MVVAVGGGSTSRAKQIGEPALQDALHERRRNAERLRSEGLFGETSRGMATKSTPREMGPRLEDGEFLDAQRHDIERAKHWLIYESKRKKYDSADGMQSFEEAYAWGSGLGNSCWSVPARVWQDKQRVAAVRAAQGKQENPRTFNTFYSNAKSLAGSSSSSSSPAV